MQGKSRTVGVSTAMPKLPTRSLSCKKFWQLHCNANAEHVDLQAFVLHQHEQVSSMSLSDLQASHDPAVTPAACLVV